MSRSLNTLPAVLLYISIAKSQRKADGVYCLRSKYRISSIELLEEKQRYQGVQFGGRLPNSYKNKEQEEGEGEGEWELRLDELVTALKLWYDAVAHPFAVIWRNLILNLLDRVYLCIYMQLPPRSYRPACTYSSCDINQITADLTTVCS